jgi:putative FmdB family regulatory protein
MPLYEFTCRACAERFEALVRNGVTPECPACGGHDLERILSLFSVNSESTRSAALKAARRQNQKVERDKRIADHEAAHHHHD